MVIANVPDIDALIARYLLPSAPVELAEEVYRHLSESQSRGGLQASRNGAPGSNGQSLPASREGAAHEKPPDHGQGSPSRRDPWQVLYITRCAPRAIVDIAYAFRRRSQIAPPLSHRMTVAPMPPATAEDRLAKLAAPSMTPRTSSNGVRSPRAFIETASGEHRYGIADLLLRIGTDTGCDVVLSQSGPLEVRIWPHGDRYMLRVVSGHVRVAGETATWVVLDDGDILEIGDATFRFRFKDTP